MSVRTQLRGICQCCGRQQAVVRGRMSKHGYEVKNGWFEGVCTGQHYRPMQVERKEADTIIAMVRGQCEALEAKAAVIEARTFNPETTMVPYGERLETPEELKKPLYARGRALIPFSRAKYWEQDEWVKAQVWKLQQRAKAGRDFANDLERIANEYHGKELLEVTVEPSAAPIKAGERRVNERGAVLVAKYQEGARVWWNFEGDTKKYWTGTQAWRKLAMA